MTLLRIDTPRALQGGKAVTLNTRAQRWLRGVAGAVCVSVLAGASMVQASETLSAPSTMSQLAQHNLLLDVTNAGDRLVAVGEYGHILYSDDNGANWTQTQTPVSTTLNAVHFVDADHGWAVGHEGVVLATTDGGNSWVQQLNGLELNAIGLKRAQELYEQASSGGMPMGVHPDIVPEDTEMLEMDAADFDAEGASRPLFDVWFKNKLEGMVIGAYGILLHTNDGGKSWSTGFDQIYNVENFHYYQIVPAATAEQPEGVFMMGEAGMLQRSLDSGLTWEVLESPYGGTFFGGVFDPTSGDLLAFGLRGNLFKSSDYGDSWQQLDSKTTATLADGVVLSSGSFFLVGNGGVQLTIDSTSDDVQRTNSLSRAGLSAVAVSGEGNRVFAGLKGIEVATAKQGNNQ